MPIRVLTDATGLSLVYGRQLRRGERVPNPRHWNALRTLTEKPGAPIPQGWDIEFYLRKIAAKLDTFTRGRL